MRITDETIKFMLKVLLFCSLFYFATTFGQDTSSVFISDADSIFYLPDSVINFALLQNILKNMTDNERMLADAILQNWKYDECQCYFCGVGLHMSQPMRHAITNHLAQFYLQERLRIASK